MIKLHQFILDRVDFVKKWWGSLILRNQSFQKCQQTYFWLKINKSGQKTFFSYPILGNSSMRCCILGIHRYLICRFFKPHISKLPKIGNWIMPFPGFCNFLTWFSVLRLFFLVGGSIYFTMNFHSKIFYFIVLFATTHFPGNSSSMLKVGNNFKN